MSAPKSQNIKMHGANVTPEERAEHTGQRGCVLWFTGLSASGKSTISRRVEQMVLERGHVSYVLDGDNIRFGLNKDLGFSPEDRAENIRRIGEVAKLFAEATVICGTAFISPYREDRARVRAILPEGSFIEVYVNTPIEVCEARDPKGLYKKARAGEIAEFTGITAPYEPPEAPEIELLTAELDLDACAGKVVDYLVEKGFLPH